MTEDERISRLASAAPKLTREQAARLALLLGIAGSRRGQESLDTRRAA